MVAAIEKWKVGIPKMKAHRFALATATFSWNEAVDENDETDSTT